MITRATVKGTWVTKKRGADQAGLGDAETIVLEKG